MNIGEKECRFAYLVTDIRQLACSWQLLVACGPWARLNSTLVLHTALNLVALLMQGFSKFLFSFTMRRIFVFVGSFTFLLSLHSICAYIHTRCIYEVVHSSTTCLLLDVANAFPVAGWSELAAGGTEACCNGRSSEKDGSPRLVISALPLGTWVRVLTLHRFRGKGKLLSKARLFRLSHWLMSC
jgi:hypothetical protein